MSSDPIEVLRELAARWRAKRVTEDTDLFDAGSNYELTHCADELESALASLSAPKPESAEAVIPWVREWKGSGPQRGFHIREATRLHNNRVVAYLGDQVDGDEVDKLIAEHNGKHPNGDPVRPAPPRPESAKAVGEVFGPKAVSTMVALERPLPPGTKLYTEPQQASAPVGVEGAEKLSQQHSILLNNVLWRMQVALGDVDAGETAVVCNPGQVVERFFALAQQPAAYPRPTHHVHRATESLPCYCPAKDDHPIGSEQPAAEPNIGVSVDTTAEGAHITVVVWEGAADRIVYDDFHRVVGQQPAAVDGALRKAVLEWWTEHQYDTDSHPEDGERNVYSEPPEFVRIALTQQPAATPVGVPVDVVREYLDARACYEAATRPPNSHARAPVLKHDDPDARRLREARVALDNAIVLAQQPSTESKCGHCGGFGDVTGEYPGVACPKCRGTGLTQQPAAVDEAKCPWDGGSPCVEPRPAGMVYPKKPAPRAGGYLDSSGVEWNAWDAGQMEAYARAAYSDGWEAGYRAALAQQPAAVDEVRIPASLAERVQAALGRFTSDEGWGMEDMQAADDFAAALAGQQQGGTQE